MGDIPLFPDGSYNHVCVHGGGRQQAGFTVIV